MMREESKNVSMAIQETSTKTTGDRATKYRGGILGGKENSKDTQLMNNLH